MEQFARRDACVSINAGGSHLKSTFLETANRAKVLGSGIQANPSIRETPFGPMSEAEPVDESILYRELIPATVDARGATFAYKISLKSSYANPLGQGDVL